MRTNVLGTFTVFTVLVVLTFGLPAVNRLLPADRSLQVGRVLEIGRGVTLTPPPGAKVDVTRTLPNTGVLALVLHGLDLRAEVKTTDAPLADLARRLRGRIQSQRGVQMTGELREVRTVAGVPGLRGTFSSTGREGLYVVYSAGGVSVQITVIGRTLAEQINPVEATLAGLSFP